LSKAARSISRKNINGERAEESRPMSSRKKKRIVAVSLALERCDISKSQRARASACRTRREKAQPISDEGIGHAHIGADAGSSAAAKVFREAIAECVIRLGSRPADC